MTRRVLLTCCIAGCLAGSIALTPGLTTAQQPQKPGRATIQNAPAPQNQPRPQGAAPAAGAAQPPARQQRPIAELQMPKELEQILVDWERESSKIKRLEGVILRYTYETTYSAEMRAVGKFWYEEPDLGRIDFGPGKVPPGGVNPKKLDANGKPYTVSAEGNQRWICNGTMIYVIDDDAKLADQIEIPVQQRGKNIMNGPLPFLFGMKAEQAKKRYLLSLGNMHWPQGRVDKLADGTTKDWPPQFHIVAIPKLEVDAREWCRAEVTLDARTFVPTAIRLLNPRKTKETVYLLPREKVNVNPHWLTNPFNDKPPGNYTISEPSRATNDETPVTPPK